MNLKGTVAAAPNGVTGQNFTTTVHVSIHTVFCVCVCVVYVAHRELQGVQFFIHAAQYTKGSLLLYFTGEVNRRIRGREKQRKCTREK